MITQVRREGHIQEHTPGNIATILQGPFRQARPGAYCAEPENMQTQHQQLQSYWSEWSDPEHQWPLAQQPVAAWASPYSGSQWAEAGGASWTSGSQWAEAGTDTWYPTQPGLAYFDTQQQEETDSSATSSDSGTEQLPEPAVGGMSPPDAAHHIYMQMRNAKRTWRRFTGRPVRKFRRFFKNTLTTRKGKGKGKRSSGQAFMWSQEDMVHPIMSFLSGKGKGNRSHSSGKGFGRKKNPKDRNGQIMPCHNCNSDEHLVAQFLKG